MEMTKADVYKQAVDDLLTAGFNAEFHDTYSGRGMYGGVVPAIVTDAPAMMIAETIMQSVYYFMDLDARFDDVMDAAHEFMPQRSDSMGLSVIYY